MYMFLPNYPKLKTHLRLAIFKLKLLQRKHTEYVQKIREDVADLIATGKFQKARFKIEQIIAENLFVDALEFVEMYCDLLLARFSLIVNNTELEDSLAEAVSSIIWVAPRILHDVYEFKIISNILRCKYGSAFAEACTEGNVETISESLKNKLSAPAPAKLLIEDYMVQIAKSRNIIYEHNKNSTESDPKPSGSKSLTQTPLVHFSTAFPVEPSSSTHIQTSDLTGDDDEISLEIPEEIEEKLFALNKNKMGPVQSYEMPEYPFEFNDIIYDVADLVPAWNKAEELKLAKLKRYDLPFSPLQPKISGIMKSSVTRSLPKVPNANSTQIPSGSKDIQKPLDSTSSDDKILPKKKKNVIMFIVSTKTNNETSDLPNDEYKEFLQLPTLENDSLDPARTKFDENNLPELPTVPDEDIFVLPEFPSIPNSGNVSENPDDVDYDELFARFNKLKQK